MNFGNHVDGAMRVHAPTGRRIRTDISATLFLTAPEDYDGGELLVEDTYGVHSVKLPAGDMVIYPGDQPASRDAGHARRARVVVLLDRKHDPRRRAARAALRHGHGARAPDDQQAPGHPSLVSLTGCYHNLLRMWGDA